MNKELETLVSDIKAYIAFLKQEYMIDIAICDAQGPFFLLVSKLAPNNAHTNPFCSYFKKYSKLQKECHLQQQKIRELNDNQIFFAGTCYAGMSEYIYRVYAENRYLCFISATSYCFDREKTLRRIKRTASNTDINVDQLVEIVDTFTKKNVPDKKIIEVLLSSLSKQIVLFYLLYTKQNEKYGNDIIAKISYYVLENYSSDIRIKDIASYVNYSEFYISHLFSQYYHTTLFNYINNIRINKAKELLINTDFSISKIAMLVGYSSSNYFSTMFKKTTGKTPLSYKKEKSKNIS